MHSEGSVYNMPKEDYRNNQKLQIIRVTPEHHKSIDPLSLSKAPLNDFGDEVYF